MEPQKHIPLAATILGTIGTICWCVQLIPQIWYNWRRKSTEGLPGIMCFLWALAAPPFGVYAIAQNLNLPLQIQPQIFGVLTLICWAQTLYYHNKWSTLVSVAAGLTVAGLFGAVEGVLIYFVRPAYERGVSWPITTLGIVAAVVLAVGLLPPYWELYKRGGRVVGINFIFLTIDFAGAFFSLLSLVAQQTFDVLGGVLYLVCLFLEVGIFTSQAIWLYRTRRIRKAAKAAGMTYDQYVDVTGSKAKATVEDSPPPTRDSHLPGLESLPVQPGIVTPNLPAINEKESEPETQRDMEDVDLESGVAQIPPTKSQ